MMIEESEHKVTQAIDDIAFSEFLENIPPSTVTNVSLLVEHQFTNTGFHSGNSLNTPEIQLHCPEDSCNGTRFFRCTDRHAISLPQDNFKFFYTCYV